MMEIDLPEIDEEELEKIKAQKTKEVLEDAEIAEMIALNALTPEFVKKNVYFFRLYKRDKDLCKDCAGLSECAKKSNHLQISLKIEGDRVDVLYSKCPYQEEVDRLKKKFIARQFDESAFAYKMKDCLSYFASARYPIVRKMNDFVKDVSIGKGLYLSGDPKTGKSFLLSVFAVRLSKEPTTKSIAFIDCPNEFASMQACFRDNLTMFRFYLEEMQEAQYLFLDDLGKEFKNEFVLTNLLLPLFRKRKEMKRTTFVSSNYGIKELKSAYPHPFGKKNDLEELCAIIDESCTEMKLRGMKFELLK